MNIISKNSITLNGKKVLFADVVSILESNKTVTIIDANGDITNITDPKMISKFKERLSEKANFIYYENRYINADLIKSLKLDVVMANKIFDVVVNFGNRTERFSADNEPAADTKLKEIKKLIKNYQLSNNAGLSK